MFNTKFVLSSIIFIIFLAITSVIKNKSRIIEKEILNLNTKTLIKKNNINDAQLDFYYLTSPAELEKKLDLLGFNNYQSINYSKIYFNILDFTQVQKKISNLKNLNEKNIQKEQEH